MRFIILGAGSIGQRHLRNLLNLGHEVVAVYDPSPAKLEGVHSCGSVKLLTSNESEALDQNADAALVCSPTVYHVRQARKAIEHGFNVFIEKPLSNTLRDIDVLVEKVEESGQVLLVACNLRFLPSLRLVRRLLNEGRIGEPLAVRAQCGYYLPYWRPNTDYRNGYGARQVTGGGIILDSIHEFDYLRWMLGEVVELFCYASRRSSLDIDVEDNADFLLRFDSGAVANVHLDYLQRTYRRSCEFIGEDGVIVWDYITQQVSLYGQEDRHIEVFLESINTELNQMFVDEMKHFVACVEGKEEPELNLAEGLKVLQIALAVKRSAAEGKVIRLGE
jgi:predicted dehydrogenase